MGTVPALADYGRLRGTATHSGGAAGRYAPTGAANGAGPVTAPTTTRTRFRRSRPEGSPRRAGGDGRAESGRCRDARGSPAPGLRGPGRRFHRRALARSAGADARRALRAGWAGSAPDPARPARSGPRPPRRRGRPVSRRAHIDTAMCPRAPDAAPLGRAGHGGATADLAAGPRIGCFVGVTGQRRPLGAIGTVAGVRGRSHGGAGRAGGTLRRRRCIEGRGYADIIYMVFCIARRTAKIRQRSRDIRAMRGLLPCQPVNRHPARSRRRATPGRALDGPRRNTVRQREAQGFTAVSDPVRLASIGARTSSSAVHRGRRSWREAVHIQQFVELESTHSEFP